MDARRSQRSYNAGQSRQSRKQQQSRAQCADTADLCTSDGRKLPRLELNDYVPKPSVLYWEDDALYIHVVPPSTETSCRIRYLTLAAAQTPCRRLIHFTLSLNATISSLLFLNLVTFHFLDTSLRLRPQLDRFFLLIYRDRIAIYHVHWGRKVWRTTPSIYCQHVVRQDEDVRGTPLVGRLIPGIQVL